MASVQELEQRVRNIGCKILEHRIKHIEKRGWCTLWRVRWLLYRLKWLKGDS